MNEKCEHIWPPRSFSLTEENTMEENTMEENKNPTFTVTARGEETTFTSGFANLADAYRALEAANRQDEFALDLLPLARARKLSPKQAAWLPQMATDSSLPRDRRFLAPNLNLSKIIEIFDTAFANGKKFPRIVLAEAFDGDRVETTVKIKRLGSRSKSEGCATILTANDEYAGKILRDGAVSTSRNFDDVEKVLRELAKAPLQVLAQNGIATSQCCYCARALNDARSREVGYGPICAGKFGLPWGNRKQTDAASDEAKIIIKEVK